MSLFVRHVSSSVFSIILSDIVNDLVKQKTLIEYFKLKEIFSWKIVTEIALSKIYPHNYIYFCDNCCIASKELTNIARCPIKHEMK